MTQDIKDYIDSINKDKKILFFSANGLNDFFSGIALNIQYLIMNRHSLKNLHAYSNVYDNLNDYLNFKDIKYVERPILSDYDFISSAITGGNTNTYLGTSLHLSNFISLKDEYKVDYTRIKNEIAIHIRAYNYEQHKQSLDQELETYFESFSKIYSRDEKYVVFSDNDCRERLITYKNKFSLENIRFCVPNSENINSTDTTVKKNLRKKYTLLSLQSIYEMSFAKTVYKTSGHFTSTCKLFNPNCVLKQL
jgi:hypothetical protein